jgi:hypothetical protein
MIRILTLVQFLEDNKSKATHLFTAIMASSSLYLRLSSLCVVEQDEALSTPRVHIFTRDETGLVYLPTQLSVHCNFTGDSKCSERGWGMHPPPAPAWANFTLMIECTQESCRYSVVYT